MRTILAQIELKNTNGVRLVTYSAYYTIIPGFDSVLWKLALAMASSSFDFDRVLAYALSCVKQEGLCLNSLGPKFSSQSHFHSLQLLNVPQFLFS